MSETRDEMLRERVCHWRERISQHPGYWYHEVDTDDLKLFLEALSSLSPAPVQAEGMREARLMIFLEILSAMGGRSDASDSPSHWLNAFCEGHEGTDPDTYNLAERRGYTRTSHATSFDTSTVYLTDAGRAALSQAPRPSKGGGADV